MSYRIKKILLLCLLVLQSPVLAQAPGDDPIIYDQKGLALTYQKAVYRGSVLYDVSEEAMLAEQECGSSVAVFHTPLSRFGRALSYEKNRFESSCMGGNPASTATYTHWIFLPANPCV